MCACRMIPSCAIGALAPEFLEFLAAESDRLDWITTLNNSQRIIHRAFMLTGTNDEDGVAAAIARIWPG